MTLKEHRKKAGMTQIELAETMKVTQVSISRWENGTVQPSYRTLRKLAEALKCEVSDITPPPQIAYFNYDENKTLK